MDMYEKLKDEKLEGLKNKFFGIWRGVVTNVNDPLGLGRIRAKIHELLGDKDETNWAEYCSPFGGGGHGWFFMPSPVTEGAKEPQAGDGVWIMFEAGDINRPVWIGFWFNEIDGKPKDANKDVRVLETKSGHKLIFDDNKGKEKIRIQDKSGQYIEWDCKANEININTKSGIVRLNDGMPPLQGVVTGECLCPLTGAPHIDKSSVVGASKNV